MDTKALKFATLAVHGGLNPDEPTCARGQGIYPTAAYRFRTCDHAAKLFELSEPGNIYTRLMNPTTSAYETRMAALYGGVGALATSSGMAAILLTMTSLAAEGDNIVASPYLYGGTYNLFRITLRRLGIDVRIAPECTPEAMKPLIDGRTRLVFIETMGNPTCFVPDISAIADVAHEAGVPLVADNTFGAGGFLCQPFRFGADIITDSATKWINGHGTAMGGIIVDSGRFRWTPERYPQIAGPNEGYHGLNLADAFGPSAFITKARVDGMRDMGVCPSPFDTYLMMLGLETLPLRVRHQAEATRRIAEFCASCPQVESVAFVGFDDHPSHANDVKYFDGQGLVFNMQLKGTLETTIAFVEALKICAHMTMIGDSVTTVTHPASTTHKQLSAADLEAAGVTPTLLRISPGLEDPDDIIADFSQAFKAAGI